MVEKQTYSIRHGCFPARSTSYLADLETSFYFWKCILLSLLFFPQKVGVPPPRLLSLPVPVDMLNYESRIGQWEYMKSYI